MRAAPALALALGAALAVAGCGGSTVPKGAARLTLNDPYWDRVNVEIVITRRADCDSRAAGFLSRNAFVMRKKESRSFTVPDGANLCWRHDADPKNPRPGEWSGWTKATPFPGQSAETDL